MNQAYTEFTPYTNKDSGFSGAVPAGWIEKEPGQFGRGASETDPTFLVLLGVPGATVDLVTTLLLPKIGLEALPPRAGRVENRHLGWDLYTFERQDPDAGPIVGDLAFAQSDAGVHVVLFGAVPDEYDELHYAIFACCGRANPAVCRGKRIAHGQDTSDRRGCPGRGPVDQGRETRK